MIVLTNRCQTEAELVAAYRDAGGVIGQPVSTGPILNLDATPALMDRTTSVRKHIGQGQVDMSRIQFLAYQTQAQRKGQETNGIEVLREVMEFLAEHPNIKAADAHLARYIVANPEVLPYDIRQYVKLYCPYTSFELEGYGGNGFAYYLNCESGSVGLETCHMNDGWRRAALLWYMREK